jgi:hypothetical protein
MGNKASTRVALPVIPAVTTISRVPTSFVYEDLISQVELIQQQMIEMIKSLDDRWKNEKKIRNQLKSRSLVFFDPYGNRTASKYMDHELIGTIFQKYKKDFVPRYLHQWIKIGTMDGNVISPLSDYELKSIVSKYDDGHQFITYGEVIVWIGNYEYLPPQKFVLRVLVTDDVEKIKMQLKEQRTFTNIELKSFIINQNAKPNKKEWDNGITLRSEDTIMSAQLYQDNCIIMAKIMREKVNCDFVCP